MPVNRHVEPLQIRLRERCRAYQWARGDGVDADIRTERPAKQPLLSISEWQLETATEDDLEGLDKALDDIWRRDLWEKVRLEPFIDRLTLNAEHQALSTFRQLVTSGCQPDFLAEAFYQAVMPKPLRPTAVVKEADRQAKKIAAHLLKTAALIADHLGYVGRNGLCTHARRDFPQTLREMAEAFPIETPLVSAADRSYAGLLRALDHIEKVLGTRTPRYEEALLIVNALRAASDHDLPASERREDLQTDTLMTYVKRARENRRELRATLDAARESSDSDGWEICGPAERAELATRRP